MRGNQRNDRSSSLAADRGGAWRRILVPLALAVVCAGCTNSIVFSTSYLAGVEVTPGENGQQRAKVALQKWEGVMMPGCADATTSDNWFKPCENVRPEAYSTLALSDLDTGTLLLGGLTNVRIAQVFATGKAATAAVKSGSASKAFLTIEASYDDSVSTRCVEAWLDADDAHPAELVKWWEEQGLKGQSTLLITGRGYDEKRDALIREKGLLCQ